MTVTFSWYAGSHILFIRYIGHVIADDVRITGKHILNTLHNEKPDWIQVLIDTSQMEFPPETDVATLGQVFQSALEHIKRVALVASIEPAREFIESLASHLTMPTSFFENLQMATNFLMDSASAISVLEPDESEN